LFDDKYIEEYKSQLKELENERIHTLKFFLFTFVFLMLLIAFLAYYHYNNQNTFAACLLTFLLLAVPLYTHMINKAFQDSVKEKCLSNLSVLLPFVQKTEQPLISEKELKISNLFSEFNFADYDDCFHGIYAGTEFDIADVNLRLEAPFSFSNVFKGVIIKIPFNKNIEGNTIVTRKLDYLISNGLISYIKNIVNIALVLILF